MSGAKPKPAKDAASKDGDALEDWSVKGQRITVKEDNGCNLGLTLRAKVDDRADDIYRILTDPTAVGIFRGIKECKMRKLLEEDKRKGTRKLEVVHTAIARFLFLTINFETRLFVWENDRAKTIKFEIAKEGMMKKFNGMWHVQPFTQETLDGIYHQPQKPELHHGAFNPQAFLSSIQQQLGLERQAPTSLVTLEQNILPRGTVPPGMKGLIRGLCAKQLKDMMEDLRNELERRKRAQAAASSGQAVSAVLDSGKGVGKKKSGHAGSSSSQQVASAASLTLAHSSSSGGLQLGNIWDYVSPIEITIKL